MSSLVVDVVVMLWRGSVGRSGEAKKKRVGTTSRLSSWKRLPRSLGDRDPSGFRTLPNVGVVLKSLMVVVCR